MTTLVIDAGHDIVGIFEVERGEYVRYRSGAIPAGIVRIQSADVVVTYNGELYDLEQLGKLSCMEGDPPLQGQHIDMQVVCSAAIFAAVFPGLRRSSRELRRRLFTRDNDTQFVASEERLPMIVCVLTSGSAIACIRTRLSGLADLNGELLESPNKLDDFRHGETRKPWSHQGLEKTLLRQSYGTCSDR